MTFFDQKPSLQESRLRPPSKKTPGPSRASCPPPLGPEQLVAHRGTDGTKRQRTRRKTWWMGEIAREPGPMSPGFSAELGRDSQAATAPPPHGSHSKLQDHALRKEKHGVCASGDRRAQILAPHESDAEVNSPRIDKLAQSSWWASSSSAGSCALSASTRSCSPSSRPTLSSPRSIVHPCQSPQHRKELRRLPQLLAERACASVVLFDVRLPKTLRGNQRRTEVDSDIDRFLDRRATFREDA